MRACARKGGPAFGKGLSGRQIPGFSTLAGKPDILEM
jgi:hypothetical protein